MQPYTDAQVALMQGKTLTEALVRIRQIPIERRYITRVFNSLDVALADLDTETMRLDLQAMPASTVPELLDKVRYRLAQLEIVLDFLETFKQR